MDAESSPGSKATRWPRPLPSIQDLKTLKRMRDGTSAREDYARNETGRTTRPAPRVTVNCELLNYAHPLNRTASATRWTDTRYAPSRLWTLYFFAIS